MDRNALLLTLIKLQRKKMSYNIFQSLVHYCGKLSQYLKKFKSFHNIDRIDWNDVISICG